MGKQNEPGFTGRIGPEVYYYMRGQYIKRSLPRKYKQTKSTRARATEFGRASGIARCIREQVRSILSVPSDFGMQRRLVSVVFEWMRSQPDDNKKGIQKVIELMEFNFSGSKDLRGDLHGFPEIEVSLVNGKLVQLKIPSFIPLNVIKAPRDTEKIICSIAAGVTDINNINTIETASATFDIPYDENEVAEQLISFKLPPKKNVLIVTAVSLTYFVNNKGKIQPTKNKSWMPEVMASASLLVI